MPPKRKHSGEEIVKAAVAVVEEGGLGALTARSVAARLGCSIAPVYGHFATMEELTLRVMRETQRQLLEYASRPYTDRVFLNMGTGVARFACEHRMLYRALMLEGDSYGDVVAEILDTMESGMKSDGRLTALPDGERRGLLRKMWTFTHGLASLIAVGLEKECATEHIVRTLSEMGTDVIGATLARHHGGADGKQGGKKRHEAR